MSDVVPPPGDAAGPSGPDRPTGTTPRGLARRLSVGVTDQLLSSGSNFLALLVGARYLDADGFGSFSLALLSYTLTLGITRALCSEALLVRPGDTPASHRARVADATGSAAWVGVVAAIAFSGAAVVSSTPLDRCFLLLAVAMPGLLVQDTLRYAAFARSQPRAALESDAIWFVGLLVALAVLIGRGSPSAPAMLVAFAVPGVLAGGVQAWRERVRPAVGGGPRWISRHRDLSLRYLLDFLSGAGAAQLAAYVLVVVAGVAAVGSIRGAQTIFGPVNILLTGASIVLVPEGRHAARRSKRSLTAVCVVASASFAALAAAMLGIFLVLSPAEGRLILGSTWASARTVVFPVGLASIAGGVLAGPMAGLRSLAAAKALLRIRFFTLPTTIALPIIGAVGWEAKGLAYGIAVSVWWNVAWYWSGYFRALRAFDGTVSDPTEAVPADGGER